MTTAKNTKNSQIHWIRLAITFLSIVILSFGLAYLFQKLMAEFNFLLYDFAWLAYLIVFAISVIANLTVVVPVPFTVSIMIAAATTWNPVLIALLGSIGGSIGELSGYYAGYLGKRIAIPENVSGYQRVEHWIQKYGVWAIFFLSFQPIIPFDIGGFIAGVTRMPVRKFLPALWLGKFPKYIILIYAGTGVIQFIPFLSS